MTIDDYDPSYLDIDLSRSRIQERVLVIQSKEKL